MNEIIPIQDEIIPIQEFRRQLRTAKAIAEDMLTQPVEPVIAVSYSRNIIESWDRLDRLETLSGEIEKELTELEKKLCIEGHFLTSASDTVTEPDSPASSALETLTPQPPLPRQPLPPRNDNLPPSSVRPIRIKVTQGMINENLLTLTEGVKRGLMKGREEIRIQLPNGELLTSRIMRPGNRLQERGRIRRLYLECNVKAGDFILLEKADSGEWRLRVEASRPKTNPGLSL